MAYVQKNSTIVQGVQNYGKYWIAYYKHLFLSSFLLGQHAGIRISMMEWRRDLIYFFIIGILLDMDTLSLAGVCVVFALMILIFLGIGIKDNIDLGREVRDDS